MTPNYAEFPERRAELRAEVEKLLEADGSRTGDVFRSIYRQGESLDDVQSRRGTETLATNEVDYYLPALLDGRIPVAPGIRRSVAGRLRVWLKKPLSEALRADLEAQLEAMATLAGSESSSELTKVEGEEESGEPTGGRRPFEVPEDTDRLILVRARREQARLRDHLLQGRDEAPCDLCGCRLPKELLVAAHIAPRSELDHSERTQFDRIAMVACQLGCDRLFELGYLSVDEDGVICSRASEGELVPILARLAGRECAAHNADTAAAFATHRANSLR
jgi:hypothetical protein